MVVTGESSFTPALGEIANEGTAGRDPTLQELYDTCPGPEGTYSITLMNKRQLSSFFVVQVQGLY